MLPLMGAGSDGQIRRIGRRHGRAAFRRTLLTGSAT
jgi:hypothetical protein